MSKLKLQPPKQKSIPKGNYRTSIYQRNEDSRKMSIHQFEQISFNNNHCNFDQFSFKSKYDRALDLIMKKTEIDEKKALNILEYLCDQIKKIPDKHQLSNELLENVVSNCWLLKNKFKDLFSNKQQSLKFIRHFTAFFSQIYKRNQIHKNGLHLLYLIQSNEQLEEGYPLEALKSCELSIKSCYSIKNQVHLLKVEYLRSNIFNQLKNFKEQLESIRKSLFYIGCLLSNVNEEKVRQDYNKLKLNLLERQVIAKGHLNASTNTNANESKPSINIRKRSFSQKKDQSQKKKIIETSNLPIKLHNTTTRNQAQSLQIKSVSQSKLKFREVGENKKERLTTTFGNFKKTQGQLKKRALRIQSRQNSDHNFNNIAVDEIKTITLTGFNIEELMVKRPKTRFADVKKQNKQVQQKKYDEQTELNIKKEFETQQNNQSVRQSVNSIEPVTHDVQPLLIQNTSQQQEIQHEEIVRDCVKTTQEYLIRAFIKKACYSQEELSVKNVETSKYMNQIDQNGSMDSNEMSSQKKSNYHQNLPELNLTHAQTELHKYYDIFEKNMLTNSKQVLSFCIYQGVMSRVNFQLRIEKADHKNSENQLEKYLEINLNGVLNNKENMRVKLSYKYLNVFQSKLQIILDEINKRELDNYENDGEGIIEQVCNLISNQIIVVKKINGYTLVQKNNANIKKNNPIEKYKQKLKNRFIIYQQNKLTDIFRRKQSLDEEIMQKNRKIFNLNFPINKNQDQIKKQSGGLFNQYLHKLICRLYEELNEEDIFYNSIKRIKTDFVHKTTMHSFKTKIKSYDESYLNTRLFYEDNKSMSFVQPGDFNQKISNFFEHEQQVQQTSIYQFYYCMKFLLIKPPIALMNDTLLTFYDTMQVQHLFKLNSKINALIKMTCYKVKDIFKISNQYFYKFQLQFNREKIKMMKFITSSYDISLLFKKKIENIRGSERNLKLFKTQQKSIVNFLSINNPEFCKPQMLIILKQISEKIFIKKDYIYSLIGIQTTDPHFHFINKFRLEGKTVQNKQFMIPHLKYINILIQKSIKIQCDHFKQFAVLTIMQIERSMEFSIFFYIAKYQRTYNITLQKTIINYIKQQDLKAIFGGEDNFQEKFNQLFINNNNLQDKSRLNLQWNQFTKLFKFQSHFYDDKMHLLLRIGNYSSFFKDSSFGEYFELNNKIFWLEMSINKRTSILSTEADINRKKSKRKQSSSSKEIIKRYIEISEGQSKKKILKKSGRTIKPSIIKKQNEQFPNFRRSQFFQKINIINESETSKYIIYLSLAQVYQINIENEEKDKPQFTKKINYSFYLSDLINLLKESKKELQKHEYQQKNENEFNQEIFSFSILLRTMTLIKHKLIYQLKNFKNLDHLFEGANIIENQKMFKNSLNKAFKSQNQNLYSLNTTKRLYKYDNNIYLINKSIMNIKKNIIVSIFYNEKMKMITFYMTNNNELSNKQKIFEISKIIFPCIEFYGKDQLFKVSNRIYKYYKNLLLFL